MRDDGPPHLLTESGYWRCPTQVFTGLTWFVVGVVVGGVLF